MIEIDGSYGEGGGAILRQALGLAAFAGEPLRVTSIRAGREPPGLRPQHLKAVEAVAAVCGGEVTGAELGSLEVTLEPGRIQGGRFEFDIGTAGSVTLLLQALLVPCLCGGARFSFGLVGGTDVRWSPPADYLSNVTFPALRPFGRAELRVERRGYYPKGGGRVEVVIESAGTVPSPLVLDRRARFAELRGRSHASAFLAEREVSERQAAAAREELARFEVPVRVEVEYDETFSPGSGITLWTRGPGAAVQGGSALGARGVPAESVGGEAARALATEIEAGRAVDRYLADQLVPFLAVAGGSLTTSEITLHTRSNAYVAERILGTRFELDEDGRVAAHR